MVFNICTKSNIVSSFFQLSFGMVIIYINIYIYLFQFLTSFKYIEHILCNKMCDNDDVCSETQTHIYIFMLMNNTLFRRAKLFH